MSSDDDMLGRAKKMVQEAISIIAENLSREEYTDFLDWLGAEVEVNEIALKEERT